MMFQSIYRNALILTAFALIATGVLAVVNQLTLDPIAEQKRRIIEQNIQALVSADQYDNDPVSESFNLNIESLGGEITVFPLFKSAKPVAAIFTPSAPDGYSGPIQLSVGVYSNGTLAGVRVVSHKETPGLGDKIELRKDDWILGFNGLSLIKPAEHGWKVKKDGGEFDQFTGATITPRAVVSAVHRSLEYFNKHKKQFFTLPEAEQAQNSVNKLNQADQKSASSDPLTGEEKHHG